MSRIVLPGVNGANPLGFLAAIGLLRIVSRDFCDARLGFLGDGTFHAFIEGIEADLSKIVADDAAAHPGANQPWWLTYSKEEKRGTKTVADLKAPPAAFAKYLANCLGRWLDGDADAAAYAAAFGTTVGRDGKDNTKPTALHFTAANQQFLGTVELIRSSVTSEWTFASLFHGYAARPGSNLRWDPAAERNWALMANNPNDDGTSVDAPLEWLAFRGLALLPTFPVGTRTLTTAVSGRRQDEMKMHWPLWGVPASLNTVRSVLQVNWKHDKQRASRGIFAVCESAIRRTSQGFGNFSPASAEA